MKKSAILDIFYGDRGQRERMGITKECEENLKSACKSYEELREKLSPELMELHNKHVNALENNWMEEVDYSFSNGFKLGLLIGIECMED